MVIGYKEFTITRVGELIVGENSKAEIQIMKFPTEDVLFSP